MYTNETVREIVAEMRRFGERAAVEDHVQVSPESLLLYADRLDAALARDIGAAQEKAASSAMLDRTVRDTVEYARAALARDAAPADNAAAMRSALQAARGVLVNIVCAAEGTIVQDIDAAIFAPPRNCDRYAAMNEAWLAWQDECAQAFPKPGPKFHDWLFAPAEGGAE